MLPALPTACAHVAAFWTIAWSVIFAQALGGFLDARARQGSRFQKPSARASRTRRDVIGRATHAPFEGQATGRWVLADFGDVVVHVFDRDMRGFYDLDGLWRDAPRIDPPEVEVDELPEPFFTLT